VKSVCSPPRYRQAVKATGIIIPWPALRSNVGSSASGVVMHLYCAWRQG